MKIHELIGAILSLIILLFISVSCTQNTGIETRHDNIQEIPKIVPLDLEPPLIEINADIDIHSGIATLTLLALDESGIRDILFHVGDEIVFCESSPCIKKINVYEKNITYYAIAIDDSENRNSARYPINGKLNVGLIDLVIPEEVPEEISEDKKHVSSGGGSGTRGKSSEDNKKKDRDNEKDSDNILENEQFDSSDYWTFYNNGAAEYDISSNPANNDMAYYIKISSSGSNIQLYQNNIVVESGTSYILSFDASSPSMSGMDISLLKHTTPYTYYGLNKYFVNLTEDWKKYTIKFKSPIMESAVDDARLMFWMATYADSGDEYWIDNVVLAKCIECDKAPEEKNGTIPSNTTTPKNNTINTTVNQTGSIYFTSTPLGASIYIDGIIKGTTPKTVAGVAVGNRSIKITKIGYSDYIATRYINKGQTTNITAILTQKNTSTNNTTPINNTPINNTPINNTGNTTIKETGSIYVTSTPLGTSIYIDGIIKGTTPKTVEGIAVGNRSIKITKTGYNDYTTIRYINKGQTTNITAILTPKNTSTNNTTPINNTPTNNTGNKTTPSSTLPVPSKGKKWVMTWNDEFDGTSIDKKKWNGGYSRLQWCPPGPPNPNFVNSSFRGSCPNQYAGVTVSNGVLKLQPEVNPSDKSNPNKYENRAMINNGGMDAKDAKFLQRYGYFEARIKWPTNKNGEGDYLWPSVWSLPMGKVNNEHFTKYSGYKDGGLQEEIDWFEHILRPGKMYASTSTLHDYTFSQHSVSIPKVSVGDLSEDFHTYGLYWRNDGSKYGSMQIYFDGQPQNTPWVLDSRSDYWDEGIYIILQVIPCSWDNPPICGDATSSDNPLIIDYVRVYKET